MECGAGSPHKRADLRHSQADPSSAGSIGGAHGFREASEQLLGVEGGEKARGITLSGGRKALLRRMRGGSGALERVQVLCYFGLWYVLNIMYNIANKRVLNTLALPWTVAVTQLGIGSLWVALQWASRVRAAPAVDRRAVQSMLPVAAFHGGGQMATVISLGAGAVSFTHIVKALEPFFSAIVAAIAFRQIFRPQVYLALVPVVFGVGLACYSEINFSWLSFLSAMASNAFFACRANFSKALMQRGDKGSNGISAANLYGVVTILAFLLTLPLAVSMEGSIILSKWKESIAGTTGHNLALALLTSGLTHYLNNEVMYLALHKVHPITLAVGNTMKRVFIIVASLLVFQNPISPMGCFGSCVGILGVFVYSLAKNKYT